MRARFFITMCLLGGFGGFIGSVLGAFFGSNRALFVGGLLGGLLIAPLSARVALWRRWIAPAQYWTTTMGAAIGFVAAAIVAVFSLSSPIGPVLSTGLIGLGALMGAGRHQTSTSAGSASPRERDIPEQ
jgi:hypothetical protein